MLGTAPALASTGFTQGLAVLWAGMMIGQDHHAWPMKPPAPQAQRQWARQSCPDPASWAALVCYKKKVFGNHF